MPDLLVAPRDTATEEDEAIYDSGRGDSRGYYADGAYTAAPVTRPSGSAAGSQAEDGDDPRGIFYASLLLRYRLLRANLRVEPPPTARASLDDQHPAHLSSNSKAAYVQWRYLLRTTDPVPVQVAAMDQQTVLRLLKLLTSGFLKRRREVETRTGRWVWALLGRLEEAGCLGSEDVSVVRELGKRAVWLLAGLREETVADALDEELGEEQDGVDSVDGRDGVNGASVDDKSPSAGQEEDPLMAEQEEEIEEGELSPEPELVVGASHDGEGRDSKDGAPNDQSLDPADVEAARAKLLSRLPEGDVPAASTQDDGFPSKSTLATLDMILTIVGECYGQRDLLEFRSM